MNFLKFLLCTKHAPSAVEKLNSYGNTRCYPENNSTLFGPNVARRHCCQREEAVGLNVKWKRRQTAFVVQRHMDCCYCDKCDLNTGYKHRSDLRICWHIAVRLAMSICHYRIAAEWILIKLHIFWV